MKKALRRFCFLYTALLLGGSAAAVVIGLATDYGERTGIGCNLYDALLYGIDCRGFAGAEAVEILVGFPLFLAQLSAIAVSSPSMLLPLALLWAPVLVTLHSALKRGTRSGPPRSRE